MTELIGLIDTNIFIDMLREYAPAIKWMQAHQGYAFGVPSLVRMEMVLGTESKLQLQKIVKILKPYPLVFPTEDDARLALQNFERHHLSHRIEIIDCFIAAMAFRLKLPVYSRNVRDLGVFEGVVVRAPY